MKKGDKVFYIAEHSICETEIKGVRRVVLDGIKQPDEYVILPYELGYESMTRDKLFMTTDQAQEAWRESEINNIKEMTLPVK